LEIRYEVENWDTLLELYNPEAAKTLRNQLNILNLEGFQEAVMSARNRVPVRTGRLRDSIGILGWGDLWIRGGATAPYAAYVEYGTRFMASRPFWVPPVWEAILRIRSRIEETLFRFLEAAR